MVLSSSIWGADFNSPALQLLNQFPRGGIVHIECNGSQVWKLADLLFTDVCDIEVHPLGVDLVVHLQFLPHIELRDVPSLSSQTNLKRKISKAAPARRPSANRVPRRRKPRPTAGEAPPVSSAFSRPPMRISTQGPHPRWRPGSYRTRKNTPGPWLIHHLLSTQMIILPPS